MRVLPERLRERIRSAGAITFHDWMQAALYDREEGYYNRANIQRWGREGDYRTSPERSPLFAAAFARYFAGLYESLNRPAQWTIVEVGAGAGHFAEGMLDTLQRRYPQVFTATRYLIDETSESLSKAAKGRLSRFAKRVEFVSVHDTPPIEAGLVFSNELLDSFPVHRVTRSDDQLSEFYVTVAETRATGETGEFRWTEGPLSTPRITQYLDFVGVTLREGQIAEINPGVEDWLATIADRLANGYIVTVDYGAEAPELYGTAEREQGTLRAFRRHKLVDDLLARPGEQDLTTTIDWSFVKKMGLSLGFETVEFERQDRFLLKAGLLEELEAMLAEKETEAEKVELRTSSREMILPDGMAASFQVLVQKKTY